MDYYKAIHQSLKTFIVSQLYLEEALDPAVISKLVSSKYSDKHSETRDELDIAVDKALIEISTTHPHLLPSGSLPGWQWDQYVVDEVHAHFVDEWDVTSIEQWVLFQEDDCDPSVFGNEDYAGLADQLSPEEGIADLRKAVRNAVGCDPLEDIINPMAMEKPDRVHELVIDAKRIDFELDADRKPGLTMNHPVLIRSIPDTNLDSEAFDKTMGLNRIQNTMRSLGHILITVVSFVLIFGSLFYLSDVVSNFDLIRDTESQVKWYGPWITMILGFLLFVGNHMVYKFNNA